MKSVSISNEKISELVAEYPTPFYVYDEKAMLDNVQLLLESFSAFSGFKEFFAVKALPNPSIMKVLHQSGLGMDCSSLAELVLCERAGITGEEIMFTSNCTSLEEYAKAKELGAIINLDDISHIDFLHKGLGLPELLCFRFNPGHERTGNAIIGKPEEAKFGFTREQLFEGYRQISELGVKRFGLHSMVASNELEGEYFIETVSMLVDLVAEIHRELGIKIEFINMGGGIGIPYKPEDTAVDLKKLGGDIKKVYDQKVTGTEIDGLRLTMECGRMITGPYGYLVSKVVHLKNTYKNYVGADATMANLMRPGMYGSYHHITVVGKEGEQAETLYDVTGSLCENNDKFAIDRQLPEIEIGDILVFHDAGAHGHSMGFNYNGKLRSAEVLLKTDGSSQLIRRAETLDDYFVTLDI